MILDYQCEGIIDPPKEVVAHRLRTTVVRIAPCSLMNARQTLTDELSYISISPCPPTPDFTCFETETQN